LSGLPGWTNLKVERTSATVVTVTADMLYLQASATLAMRAETVSEAIDITASGASGLDTGAEGNKWYYIWIIAKADGTINGLLSASSSSPTLPAGYIFTALVSAVCNSAGDFISFTQQDRRYEYTAWQTAASGNVGLTPWVDIDVSSLVPSGISNLAFGTLSYGNESAIANDGTIADSYTKAPNKFVTAAGITGNEMIYWEFYLKVANTLYWVSNDATSHVYLAGFIVNKLS
jgi:hypothetical protein